MPRPIEQIEKALKDNQAEFDRLAKQAGGIQERLLGLAVSLRKGGAEEINAIGRDYIARRDMSRDWRWAGWDEPVWQDYAPHDHDPFDPIRLGGMDEEGRLPGEHVIDTSVVVPLFRANGPLIFYHEKRPAAEARNIFQSFLLRIALHWPGQVRFTLLDPTGIGAAYPFRGFLSRDSVRATGRSAMDELSETLDDIRRINERVIGAAPRFSALGPDQRAGEAFEIIAVADFPKAYARDSRVLEALTTIANAGVRAGRHLILEWDRSQPLPHGFDAKQLTGAISIDLDDARLKPDPLPDAGRQRALIERSQTAAGKRGAGDWNATVRPVVLMQESAKDRIATPVGERLTVWFGEAEDNKPSAHAMIAGQVGSGKSYFLHVIVTGLAARYSPDELRFTLIDGKQGVEFEVYRHLPHADIVCLRSSPALARSVLADFVEEMEQRYTRFQDINVVKLADYRARTGERLPRRLLVIDEYQQILEGDSEVGARLLGRLLEKGRAAGMHVILGSQTFEQPGLPYSAFSHIQTWAALSLAQNYVQSLQTFGAEGKRLIRDLAGTGEVVLNDEGGRDGANARGAVARLRTRDGEDLLGGIVAEITTAAGGGAVPVVLSGRDGALPSDNPHLASGQAAALSPDALQALARRPMRDGGLGIESWSAGDRPIPLWLGRAFDVRNHTLCALKRAPAHNLLIVGSQAEVRHRMLAAALAGIGAMLPPNAVTFSLIDGLRDDFPGGGMVVNGLMRLAEAGFLVEQIGPEQMSAHLDGLAARTEAVDPALPSHVLIIADPDYLYDLHGGGDRFAAPKDGAAAALRRILTRGPQAGLHTVLTVSSLSAFQLILSPARDTTLFNHKVVQQMNEQDSTALFSTFLAARLRERTDHPNAALYVDQISGTGQAVLFHGYCANRALGGDQGLAALKAELARIGYPGRIADVA